MRKYLLMMVFVFGMLIFTNEVSADTGGVSPSSVPPKASTIKDDGRIDTIKESKSLENAQNTEDIQEDENYDDVIDVENDKDVDNDEEVEVEDEDRDILDLELINITSGLTKKREVTFDDVRNISGEAKEGTKIIFEVYHDEDQEDKDTYSQTVGASGFFNQLINLEEGKNYIEIIVKREDAEKVFTFEINRKDKEIKKELENIKIDNILSDSTESAENKTLESLIK